MMIKLKNILSEKFEVGKVYPNPYHTAFKSESQIKEEENSVNESTGFDSRTGLFYLSGVPFTRERVKEVIRFFQGINVNKYTKSAVNQFEYTPSLIVKDKTGREEVLIDSKKLKMLVDFYKKNSAKLASDKDF
jgi:hypothetical protein